MENTVQICYSFYITIGYLLIKGGKLWLTKEKQYRWF